jgi:hypothetical protein
MMNRQASRSHSVHAPRLLRFCCALAITAIASDASARSPFLYAGEPVHPACVHALVMHQGDEVPVTTAVSLEGCAVSERSKSKLQFGREITYFEDAAVLGGGSFGYRELTQLDNGIYALAIVRVHPGGEERISLAAVEIVERPMVRHSQIVQLKQLELLGEIWIPNMDLFSFKSMGNVVIFSAGEGTEKVERKFDFTRLGRMRK